VKLATRGAARDAKRRSKKCAEKEKALTMIESTTADAERHKITMFLEEVGLDYTIHPVDISAGDQFKSEFLHISPNNRMPAIVDPEPSDGGEPISVFESGAILVYLAEKTGKLLPGDLRSQDSARPRYGPFPQPQLFRLSRTDKRGFPGARHPGCR
jgi:hypothetical protein